MAYERRDRGDRDRGDRHDSDSRGGSRRFSDLGPSGRGVRKVTYKDVDVLRKLMTSSAKMVSRRRAGTNAQEQALIRQAIKRARFLALLPYAGT